MTWTEDSEWSRWDWKQDVASGDTQLGYWDWVKHNKEAAEVPVTCPQCHGKDDACTLCNGTGSVTRDQHAEYATQYPDRQ